MIDLSILWSYIRRRIEYFVAGVAIITDYDGASPAAELDRYPTKTKRITAMPLFLSAVSSAVPGFTENGKQYGQLVPTTDLLEKMDDRHGQSVPHTFVRDKLGVASIAFTSTTLSICQRLWDSRCAGRSAYLTAHGALNTDIYSMLRDVIPRVTTSIDTSAIVQHFHIAAAMAPSGMFRVRDALLQSGLNSSIPSAILPEGCSGILSAISLADRLLGERESCLITAESDMSIYSHQRISQRLSQENIDNWLWGALFGEGVGAMLVSRAPASPNSLAINSFATEVVENDWRVSLNPAPSGDQVVMNIKAKAVKKTYLEHVTRNAELIIDAANGVESISHLCLHESNPKLVAHVAAAVGMPPIKTVSICHCTGSLAGVSIFSLLDQAVNNPDHHRIAVVVIGEAGGVIRAGRFLASNNGG